MHFHSYSIKELRCIHKQTLHHLLISHSLQIDHRRCSVEFID
jgi:hypothetical protein